MEFIVLVLGLGLLAGLVVRKKGDNTMDTLSKGCGCIILIIIILMIFYTYQASINANP
ncbi:MAG: hypothetical protein VX573_00010 [Bacteroidota bacterium]|nr:hypothetical protein [Bacteroidota bacterium]